MTESVLEKKYEEPNRPYSHKEIQLNRCQFYSYMRLSKIRIEHPECGHFYYAKVNSHKEKEYQETGNKNVGKCSVCWKIRHTPPHLKNIAKNMVDFYGKYYIEPINWSYFDCFTEKSFYTWLYKEYTHNNNKYGTAEKTERNTSKKSQKY